MAAKILPFTLPECCSHETHAALKLDPAALARIKYKGLWFVAGDVFEMYQCHCGSDLLLLVEGSDGEGAVVQW
jgi:hypothetical protein